MYIRIVDLVALITPTVKSWLNQTDLGAVDVGDTKELAVLLLLAHNGAEGSHQNGHGTLE